MRFVGGGAPERGLKKLARLRGAGVGEAKGEGGVGTEVEPCPRGQRSEVTGARGGWLLPPRG